VGAARCGPRPGALPAAILAGKPRQGWSCVAACVLKRLAVALPSLLIASLIVFTCPRLIAGDAMQLMLEERGYGTDLEDLRGSSASAARSL
jgi:hypothetical protein